MKRPIIAFLAGINAGVAIILIASGDWRAALVSGTVALLCWWLRTKVE